jgi:Mediator of RNA polymerase II transcription subunit 1
MKTPASGQAYTHNLSGSSHPPSTPLAAPAFGEDPLNFNSPTAIMMSSLGSHGFTPLPSGGDGLGISTDLNAVTNGAASALGSRNPEEEKSARIQEVIKLLRTSTAGRGIYREGVERLAQLAGFTHMWQGDTLAIAGTCVDLEITFDAIEKDKTTDVVLKINFTAESEEHKKDASEVLKVNLAPSTESGNQLPWHNLESFAINLEYLGRMDRLSQGINCFEAIDGLYLSFRRIWEQEKQSMGQARELDRLSQGRLGRPLLNRNEKIGLCLEYWAERRRALVTTLSRTTDDTMQIFQAESSNERNDRIVGTWAASINCEAGYPSLRVSKDWIEESSFDAVQSGDGAVDETLKPEISWAEPPPSLVPPVESTNKSNAIDLEDPDIKMANPPQVRFVVNLEPPVLLPYSHISTISNGPGISVAFDDTSKLTTKRFATWV